MRKTFSRDLTVDGTPFTAGTEVETDDLPAGSVDSLLRLGQLIEPEDWLPVCDDSAETMGSEREGEQVGDWRDRPVSDLSLPARIEQDLESAKLETIRDVIDYGSKEGTLTSIEGIGESSEEKIKRAIESAQS